MRVLRIVLGVLLLVGGLYVLVGEHFSGTSADATVNARINVVRAPIDGTVNLAMRNIGARVNSGETIADIIDDRFDTTRLIDLERAREGQQIDLRRLREQQAILTKAWKGFEAQVASYQRGRINQIEARIAESRSAESAADARRQEAQAALKRTNELSERGVQTAANLDRAKAASDVATQDLESVKQRTNYLQTELSAAQDGVFLGDSYNDVPFSSQRMRELELRLGELKSEIEQADARSAQLERQINLERIRVNKLTSATLSARVDGVLWDLLIDDGEFSRRGQDLVRLVDCQSLMVTASVAESLYDSLTVGAPVQFRLFGDSRVFDGTVLRLGGSGASNLYVNLAVGPSAEHLKRFDVTVSVPALTGQSDLTCAVGRTGRVIFTGGPISSFRRFLTRYGF